MSAPNGSNRSDGSNGSDGAVVVVHARWRVAAPHLDDVLALVAEVARRSREEPGCLAYEVLASDAEPDAVVLLERYRDDAALEAHRASTHFRELVVGRIVPMLAERKVDVLRVRKLPE